MPSHKILNIARPDTSQQQALSKALGIPKILSSVLINRGLKSASEAEKFLNTKTEHLLDPYSFSDMPKAVNIIKNGDSVSGEILVDTTINGGGQSFMATLSPQDVRNFQSYGSDKPYPANSIQLEVNSFEEYVFYNIDDRFHIF